MSAQHTPGPWKVVEPMHGHKTEYMCVQIGADEMYTTLEMLPPDAHLIAAAPDLLDACKGADAYLSVLCEGRGLAPTKDPTIKALRAAIKKAVQR